MKIIILPSWYENVQNEQEGIFFRNQAEALQRAGHEVTILVAHILNWPYHSVKEWFVIKEYYKNNIHVIYTSVPTFGTSFVSPIFFGIFCYHYMRLFRYYKKNNTADILYAHSFWPAGYAALQIKNTYNIPLVIQEHRSIVMNETIPQSSWKYLKETIENADLFWSVSKPLKDIIEKRIGVYGKIDVMPNMVDDTFRRTPKKNNDKFIFLSVGNLIKRKRMDLLVEAFCESFLEDSELWIIGDGEQKEKILSLINSFDASKKVKMLGRKNGKEVAEAMNMCDVFVMVSEEESFGVVYIEALAVGKPVIASRNGGANDLVNSNNGILIDVNNKEQLMKAMSDIKSRIKEYDGDNISSKCLEKYSSQSIAKEQIEEFTKILKKI